jgi:AAA domain/UvrD-like helicase C-terminal domain
MKTYFSFTLNAQQEAAFAALQAFVKGNDRVFILKGYAGTGKTTLMGGFIDWLMEQHKPFILTASTGRAAQMLGQKAQVEASTVHSVLYGFKNIIEKIDALPEVKKGKTKRFSKAKIYFQFELNFPSDDQVIYIVDEASMVAGIESKMSSNSFAKFGEGNLLRDLITNKPKARFLFVGDPLQLPPVGEELSKALSVADFINDFGIEPKSITLTDIMRQADENDIIEASMSLRTLHDQVYDKPKQFYPLPLIGYYNIRLHPDQKLFVQAYADMVAVKGVEHAVMICHSNPDCLIINKYLRKQLFKSDLDIVIGDVLLITQNCASKDLYNGDMVTVKGLGSTFYHCGLNFKPVTLYHHQSKKNIETYLILNVLTSRLTNINVIQHNMLIKDFDERMAHEEIYRGNKEYNNRLYTDPFLNATRAVYGFAITCHKSQGGEWPEVFLYIANSVKIMSNNQWLRWAYTAVSRPTKTLHVVDNEYITKRITH